MTLLQELGIRAIFWYGLLIIPFLQILYKNHRNRAIFSALFQIFQAGLICFVMLNIEQLNFFQNVLPIAPWLPGLPFTLFVDKISLIMCVLISLVSSCVQLYSLGYMKPEETSRFLGLLTFFSSMMQTLVLSGNLLMLFLAWEGIGIASFLLIGFYRDTLSLKNSVIALISNRIGDAGLLFALIAIFSEHQTLDYSALLQKSAVVSDPILFSIFLGIAFKSAQWPLHFWLPGSMSAPTPVSALLHAATLVTAGVYLSIRILPFMPLSSSLFFYIQTISCITIVWMGCVALFQSNIKKLIAYSTISQLGYMILAVSLHLPQLGFFHLWTHGFFKALLFLVAGVATHRANGSQNLEDLKGVFAKDSLMTMITLTALFSLAGVPGFAGFYSKERLIHWIVTHDVGMMISFSTLLGSMLTAMYCGRLAAILLVSDKEPKKWHKSSPLLVFSLFILSLMTIWSGPLGESTYFGILAPEDSRDWKFFNEALETGWILIFLGAFLIVYRLMQKLHSVFPLHASVVTTLYNIEQELYYPFFITTYSQAMYFGCSRVFHRVQMLFIENGLPRSTHYLAQFASRFVVTQQNGLIAHSLLQSLGVGLGFFILYAIRGL